MINSKLFS